ncbi:DUF1298 domain-containing protein [Rhodococcus triatomae]|uniref:O-acyltransferase WSD1 C-terminal domain-containing protein n=1 Tax=Rhodococcus triatomae TaxID=300028 RepID=A0A1G8RIG1_9NOCA|nr:WS/DGAT domain-containing protein [Rhodococcus triatomae]QNG19935.1 DUF1298 domain-containing protein [Rhodococcus triatomae]QNG24150.1 DUF1298 domain-containing protein [Rhodococcus triatomae]SDJ16766.1 Protein of unknown function [Rhodococcus triatomae]
MQLTPADAQMSWIGRRIRNDQFQLYCFSGTDGRSGPGDDGVAAARRHIGDRVDRIGELQVHAVPVPGDLDYPYWARRGQGPDQIRVHSLADRSWAGFQRALGDLLATSLDITESPWQVHLFPAVTGAPRCSEPALVAVFQVSHAFADGRRASASARQLFGPGLPPGSPAPTRAPFAPAMLARAAAKIPGQVAGTVSVARRSLAAQRAVRAAEAAGAVPPPADGFPLTRVNTDPGPSRTARMLVCDAARLTGAGVTVTVAAATAISVALARYLAEHGADIAALGAEVTVAVPDPTGRSRNSYRNVGVGLFPEVADLRERAARIAADLAERRRRLDDPNVALAGGSVEYVPARMLRRGIERYDLSAVPATVAGNTVISSVHRGAADLRLAGRRVRFTAGFPGLSPVMGLTHGVHGIGGTVTLGVLTGSRAMPDPDHYLELLDAAVDEVAGSLRG